VRRRLLTLQSELPGELVGRTEAEIERIVSEQIEQTLREFRVDQAVSVSSATRLTGKFA
jgi:hypothetical protein